jgi:hypothetical protein
MNEVILELGEGRLTIHGKKRIGYEMFQKGEHFLAAAILLHRHKGHQEVVIHLLCQGIEIVQKGMLLFRDFDKYEPKLQSPLGHNLIRGSKSFCEAFRLKPLKKATQQELELLNNYYCKHLLRYGGIHDIFGRGGQDLEFQRVIRRAAALKRYGHGLFK